MRSRLGKRQNQQVHNRRAAEYACQDRQDRRTEYQGVAAQMPDRIKPSRNGGGTDGIARQQGTAQILRPLQGGLDLSGTGLKAKRAGRRTV
ncbi:hypothetical protein IBX83_00060 [Neisseria gonorrhoeae]|uniref:hypothetical protein n=1 Tax=Neisseria gonorrhoeae TaxID=485 RepID=UPI00177DE95C|nr:hypothetical protein [Neisseria gonorrhoeae]QOG52314.1 hypothetical protein IBX83_00060 [Neisseria gonorrhoeae]